jgi:uncharacterized protein
VTTREHPARTTITDQHTLPRSLGMHLLPGVLTAAIFYGAAPLVMAAGYPAIAAGVLAGALGVTGFELAWLLREAHRRTGRRSLSAVLPYRPGPFTRRRAALVVGLLVWAVLASMLTADARTALRVALFWWMPGWAVAPLPADVADTATTSVLVLTAVGYVLVLVVVAPIVEELYFRGYLLPRLARLGVLAPLVNVVLFALYHLWKPWDALTLVVVLAPMVYVVWHTRDIRIGIAVHVGLNGLGFVLNVAPVLLPG